MKINEINGFGASQDSTVPGGTRPSPESAKALKKYFQTFSDTSETYVSEGESLPASLEWSTCDELPSGFHEITKNLENQ